MITLWPVVAPLAAFALARALMGRRQRDALTRKGNR